MLDKRKPLDHAFIEGMRDRIEVAKIIDKFQDHVKDPNAHPLSMSQLKAGEVLLRKCMPDLKAVEHADKPSRPATREELIEQLAALHAAATSEPDATAARASAVADQAASLPH